jgi:hypothetical protein
LKFPQVKSESDKYEEVVVGGSEGDAAAFDTTAHRPELKLAFKLSTYVLCLVV